MRANRMFRQHVRGQRPYNGLLPEHGARAVGATASDAVSRILPRGPCGGQDRHTQVYDFTLEWIPLEKLGLHIERQKGTADVLVMDQAEQAPSAN
jgi:hypothetical protein